MKTVFTYAHVKWFYGQSERAYYLNYFIIYFLKLLNAQTFFLIRKLLTLIYKTGLVAITRQPPVMPFVNKQRTFE